MLCTGVSLIGLYWRLFPIFLSDNDDFSGTLIGIDFLHYIISKGGSK